MKQYFPSPSENPLIDEDVDVLVKEDVESIYSVIVWNDDVNTFDHVEDTLIETCGHTSEQAHQCAIIIHYKGKCSVKRGSYDDMKPICEAILDRQINATVEKLN